MARRWLLLDVLVLGILVVLAVFPRESESARQAYSRNNIAQFGRAMHLYAAGSGGQWPDTLRQLVEKGMRVPYDPSMDLLTNPDRPNTKPGYVYLKPAMPLGQVANPGRKIFLYEAHDQWGPGINVGFLDGHVAFLADQAEFERSLAESKATEAWDGRNWQAENPATQPATPAPK